MKRLREILFGVALVSLATLYERDQEKRNATRMEQKVLDSPRSSGYRYPRKHFSFLEGRMKYWRWLLNVVLTFAVALWFWTISAGWAHAQSRPVRIDPLVVNNLDFMLHSVQERAKLEGIFCALGRVTPDSVQVSALTIAWIDSASSASAFSKASCFQNITVGTVHTHPRLEGPYECVPSLTDQHSLYHSTFLVAFVACRKPNGGVEIVSYWRSEEDPLDHDTAVSGPNEGHWKIAYRYKRDP